jgi:hypothetical protein
VVGKPGIQRRPAALGMLFKESCEYLSHGTPPRMLLK